MGTAGGAESTAFSNALERLSPNLSLRPPAFLSPTDIPFPWDTKPASYLSVAARVAWGGGRPGYSELGNEPNLGQARSQPLPRA